MRLVTRRIWRAFPELDRFDDERCARFVAAANRQIVWRVIRWIAVAAAAVAGLLSTGIVLFLEDCAVRWGWVGANYIRHALAGPRWLSTDWALGLILVWHFALAALCGALARDFLLRLRVRTVLRTRGYCFSCHYPLLGLPVEEGLQVTCPECGHRTEVDPALGELSDSEDGARFLPSAELLRRSDPTRFRRAAKKALKWAAVACVLAVTAGVVTLGMYELRIRRQAARARAMPTGMEQLDTLLQWVNPVGDPSAVNGFDLFPAIETAVANAEKRVWPEGRPGAAPGTSRSILLEPSYVYRVPDASDTDEVRAEVAASAGQARLMIAEMERAGVFDALDRAASAPLRRPKLGLAPGAPLISLTLPELYQLRGGAQWCAARCVVAAERGDAAVVERSLRTGFGLARMSESIPWLMGRAIGSSIDGLMHQRARAVLGANPSKEMVAAVERALKSETPSQPAWTAFEAERISTTDFVRWVFQDPDNVRWGMLNPRFRVLYGQFTAMGRGKVEGRLGTLEENLAVVNAKADAAVARAKQPPSSRGPLVVASPSGLAIPDCFDGGATWQDHLLISIDRVELDRVGLLIMIALERYRLETGRYPRSLGDLVPSQLAQVPMDPYTSLLFGYHVTDAASDPHRRGYLLYSVGIDRADNGGAPASFFLDALTTGRATGYDFIINDPAR